MGCWTVYCTLCSGPMNETIRFMPQKWLRHITLLLPGEKPKHGFKEYTCTVDFKKGSEKHTFLCPGAPNKTRGTDIGFAVHTDCWKFAKKVIDYELVYEDLVQAAKKCKTEYILNNINYGPIKKYAIGQHFNEKYSEEDDRNLIQHKNEWYLLYSPLGQSKQSQQNAKRIKKIIKDIFKKIKNKRKGSSKKSQSNKDRKGPSDSATLYKVGDTLKGNDGQMWIIVKDKNGVKRWKRDKQSQSGGSSYYHKYMKYKTKYLQLKNN